MSDELRRPRLFTRVYLALVLVFFATIYLSHWVSRLQFGSARTTMHVHVAQDVAREWTFLARTRGAASASAFLERFNDAGHFHVQRIVGGPTQQEIESCFESSAVGVGRCPERTVIVPLGETYEHGHLRVRRVGGKSAKGTAMALVLWLSPLLSLALVAWYIERDHVVPLAKLQATARAMGLGNLKARTTLSRSDEIGELGSTLNEMAERVASLIDDQRQILARASHELRTPLTRIRLALEMVQRDEGNCLRRELPEIRHDVAQLERLIEDILIAARMDCIAQGGKAGHNFEVSRHDADEFVQVAARRFRRAHPSRTLVVHGSQANIQVDWDARAMHRALDNVLNNAARYSPADTPIEIAVRVEQGAWAITVRDRGPGFDDHEMPHLFEPFFRGQRSLATSSIGAGLGLALVASVIEAHGGQVRAANAEGGGGMLTMIWHSMPPT